MWFHCLLYVISLMFCQLSMCNAKSSSHHAVISPYYLQQRMSEEEQITEGLGGLEEMDLFKERVKT